MLSSNIPDYKAKRFAQDATSGFIRTVPTTSSDPAAASFTLGFPPQTFTNESAGGTPPDGRDFNGILNYLSAWAQWVGLGGPVPYNSAVSSSGGYPKGARVQSATTAPRIWLSTTENNTTNPDAGGAGWVTDVSTTYSDFNGAGSGNVTVPSWATHADVQVVGAGGGGGGAGSTSSGGGGGAGGYGYGVLSVTPGASMPYVVGAGGASGPSTLNGGDGGNSTFGGITAGGGGGGSLSARAAGGLPGTCSGPVRNNTGGDGGDGSTSSVNVPGGNGASGPFGGEGRTGNPGGVIGHAPGAGGGGGWGVSSAPGGAGADGCVRILWLR